MRNETVHAYLLHQAPFREKSRLSRIFTLESGRLDAVIRGGGVPLFQSFRALATGKKSLKQLDQTELVGASHVLRGRGNYAGLYLNELLFRMLTPEQPQPVVFEAYIRALNQLGELYGPAGIDTRQEMDQLSRILRPFELSLLHELGYGLQFKTDRYGQPLDPLLTYIYQAGQGFEAAEGKEGAPEQGVYPGSQVLEAARQLSDTDTIWSTETIRLLNRICRLEVNQVLGNQPLHSRALWQASQLARDSVSSAKKD